jgi:hypothetical protein
VGEKFVLCRKGFDIDENEHWMTPELESRRERDGGRWNHVERSSSSTATNEKLPY